MLRPTPGEVLSGLQRTIVETFLPELGSPYAQSQATNAAGVLGFVALSLERTVAYDAAEIDDLKATAAAIAAAAGATPLEPQNLRLALAEAERALKSELGDRRRLEAALSEFAAALALGRLSGKMAEEVRAYLRRHLDRMRALLGNAAGLRG